jgi:cob(I)alamin adenosyltransferase
MKGYIQVYTGNGKGKTTAALGLALRAAGAGKKVYFAQFVKGKTYSEIKAILKYLPDITIKQYGRGCFIVKAPTSEDIEAARNGLDTVAEIVESGKYDLVVLDEATIAIYYELFSVSELIGVLLRKPEETEVVVTGRYAPEELIEFADLVTEMKQVKHYYTKGIQARKGIEY